MKKLILLTACIFGLGLSLQAQSIADHALGLRLGDNDGFGTEVSYQHALSENNRLELDLGWRSSHNVDAFKLTGLYQWVWNLDQGFNWYVGAGGGLGSVDTEFTDSELFVLVAGDIGIEYDFDFPLLLSLDFRPEIAFNDYYDDLGLDIALGIRYQF